MCRWVATRATDGERMWAFRHSSEGKSRSLFFTKDVGTYV